MAIGRDLMNVPMGDMIRQMAFAIADAQLELDESSLRAAEMMSGTIQEVDDAGNRSEVDSRIYFGKDKDGNADKVSMLELGFTPTFYQFIDTLIEVKMAIKVTRETETTRTTKGTVRSLHINRRGIRITSTPVDATYSSKYSYSAEGSSVLRTKMAPVPPPAILEERIRDLIEEESEA
jgi:hypothetical protein